MSDKRAPRRSLDDWMERVMQEKWINRRCMV